MFQIPLRLLNALRLQVPAAVVAATAVSTIVFVATPFLIPAIADDRTIGTGIVGLISTAQLLAFTGASLLAPRWLRPRRRTMAAAIGLGVVTHLASAVAPSFELLLVARFGAGLSLGLVSWIAWAEVFGDDERVGDVAVITPIVSAVASPLIATTLDITGPSGLFVVLSVLYLIPLPFIRSMRLDIVVPPKSERHPATRAAIVLLAALGMLTVGGSSTFVFAAAIGQEVIGLTPLAASLVFSANALASIPTARYRGQRPCAGRWLLVTAFAALVVGTVHHPIVFALAMAAWGFSFWMGVPGSFSLLAKVSNFPSERAGDAQSVMAAGRVIGPLIGGALYEISPAVLGAVSATIIATAAILIMRAERSVTRSAEQLGSVLGANR